MIYVYAIADRPDVSLPCRFGLNDEALAAVVWHDLAAVVSNFDGAIVSKTAGEVWRHEEVVEALMEERTVLPARFGTLLPSREQVRDMLCRAYDALGGDLARVRGQVEIGLRFMNARENDGPDNQSTDGSVSLGTGPGSAYLQVRLARERALRNRRQAGMKAIQDVYEWLARHATASRLDREPGDRHGISAAFLVPRERVTSFQAVVGDVAASRPDLALLCTGPWPPYSFVGAGERATDHREECHVG